MKKKDILGNEPEIGDLIAFNPPGYKGIISSKVVGISPGGLPIVEKNITRSTNKNNNTPKTGFVIVKTDRWL